jgi:tRNA threonylcarbamoyladenosine biosynthesis protein TsaB
MTDISGEKTHARLLTALIEDLLRQCNCQLTDIQAIAVAKGPGSYTGLRIGVSVTKGLCFALDKPLISVGTLEAMACQVIDYQSDDNLLFCPMLDARRMEVYAAVYNASLETILPVSAVIVDESSFVEILSDKKILFFGNGAAKCQPVLGHQPNALFLENIFPSARQIGKLATGKFKQNIFEDVAYFEPFYLKEFLGNVSNKQRMEMENKNL